MEVYVLDGLLRRIAVVDVFESLVWTERHAEIGDFQLVVLSNSGNKNLLREGTRLAINESYRVMTVETVEDVTDTDQRRLLKVKGRSLEAILEDRVLFQTFAGYNRMSWTIQDLPPGEAARQMFDSICVSGIVHPSDIIPFVVSGTLYPTETIPEPTNLLRETLDPMPLYKALKQVLDPYDMGIRLYRDPNTAKLYFNVYTGNDRTTRQSVLAPVVFSPELENLQNTSSLRSIEKSKNVAYVYLKANGASVNVYQDDSGPQVEGFDRRCLYVEVDSLPDGMLLPVPPEGIADPSTFDYAANDAKHVAMENYLIRVGKDALVEARPYMAFDGEVDQNSTHVYGVHYQLGDLAEQRSEDGQTNYMRVTEQIFASDAEGDRAYPTMVKELFTSAGSWGSWRYNKAWSEMADTETWANQPN